MPIQLGNAYGKIVIDSSGVRSSIMSAKAQMNSLKSTFNSAGQKMAGAMKMAAVAGGAALAGLSVLAVKGGISLESAFAGVTKTTEGLRDEFGNLTEAGKLMLQGYQDLAKEVPIAVEELMAIGELGGQLGIARENLLDFSETIAAMGVATNLTTEAAAEGFAQIANIMGTSQDEIERMGSAVVELGNNMATTEADILNFAQRIAGAGEIAGLSEAEVFGIGAAFSSVGIQAEAGGTAVQKVLLTMTEAVASGGGELEKFAQAAGLSAQEFADQWATEGGPASLFTQFVEQLGASGDEAINILSDLGLEDQRLIRSFLSLAGAGELLSESIDMSSEAWEENVALAEEAEQRFETTRSEIKKFINVLRDIGLTFADAILPVFNQMLDIIRPLIERFGEFFRKFKGYIQDGAQPLEALKAALYGMVSKEMLARIIQLINQFTAFKNRLVEILTPVWEFITQFVNMKDVVIGAALAIGAILIPVIWAALVPVLAVIAAIAAAIAVVALMRNAWENNWLGIRDKMTEVWGVLQPALQQLWSWLQEKLPIALQWLKNAWQTVLLPALQNFWLWLQTNLFPMFTTLWNWLATNIPMAIQTLADFWTNTLKPAIEAVWSWMTEVVFPFWESLANLLEVVVGKAIEALAAFWENVLQPALEDVWKVLSEHLQPAWESLQEFIDGALKTALEWLDGFLNTIASTLEAVAGWIEKVTGWINDLAENLDNLEIPEWLQRSSPSEIEQSLMGTAEQLSQLPGMMTAAWGVVWPVLEKVWNWLQMQIPQAIQWLTTIWQTMLVPALTNFWLWMQTYFFPMLNMLWTWLQVQIPLAVQILSEVWLNTLLPAMEEVWAWMSEVLVPFLEAFIELLEIKLGNALLLLEELWSVNLLEAMTLVWLFIKEQLLPVLARLKEFILGPLKQALVWLKGYLRSVERGLYGVADAIYAVVEAMAALADAMQNLNAGILHRESPSELELSLMGAGELMRMLSRSRLPELQRRLNMLNDPALASSGGSREAGRKGKVGQANPTPTVNFNYRDTTLDEGELMRTMNNWSTLYGPA